MKQLNVWQKLLNMAARKAKYLLIALMTALLIAFLFQIGSISLANPPDPQKATFDPSQMINGKLQISTKAFRGTVRVYPNGGKQEKTPQEYPVLTGSSKVRDQLWVAGGSTKSWAHFQFWGKEIHQKSRVDPLVQAGTSQSPTRYTFPCKMTVGAGIIGWGLTKVGGGACERIALGSSRYIKGGAGSFLAEKSQTKAVLETENIAQDASDPNQLTISRSQDLTLVYVYDLEGDIAVDVLVGSVKISPVTSSPSVSAGNRYIYPRNGVEPKLEKIDPTEVSKSPSLNAFLDKANWSSDVAPLIDKLNSKLSTAPRPTKEQQEILDAHNRWRSQVNVLPLRWSKELADAAQTWANNLSARGVIEHNGGRPSGAGENIAAASSSVTNMVDMWGNEGKDYNRTTNSCSGSSCGHYTQVVWKNTTNLGCGVAPIRRYGMVLVCNYDPPGNVNGEPPY